MGSGAGIAHLRRRPQRQIYAKFATSYIPRTNMISPDGKILFQSAGFRPEEFERMVKVIDEAIMAASQHTAWK